MGLLLGLLPGSSFSEVEEAGGALRCRGAKARRGVAGLRAARLLGREVDGLDAQLPPLHREEVGEAVGRVAHQRVEPRQLAHREEAGVVAPGVGHLRSTTYERVEMSVR